MHLSERTLPLIWFIYTYVFHPYYNRLFCIDHMFFSNDILNGPHTIFYKSEFLVDLYEPKRREQRSSLDMDRFHALDS